MNEDHTRTALVGQGLLTEQEPSLSYADKFIRVKQALIEDPARTDGLISKTLGADVASKATVYRVREVLVAEGVIPNVPIIKRVAQRGGLARANQASNYRNGNGNRIFVPEGKTVIELCRSAMAAEDAGMSAEDAARTIGIGVRSFREGKYVILVNDCPDLSEIERAIVNTAMREMEETKRTSAPYARIKEISGRLFGNALRRTSKTITRVVEKRNARFQNTMAVLVETCTSASGVDVPLLDEEGTAYAISQVEEAIKNLKLLKRSITERRWK